MRVLVPLPIVLPLAAAGIAMAFYRNTVVQRFVGVIAMSGTVAASVALVVRVHQEGTVAVDMGAWPAPIGITLVADMFAVVLLMVSAVVVLAVLLYAVGHPGTADHALFFHPIYLVLAAGVSASYLTGDLFNLFVAVEIMLMASYVLITLGAGRAQVRTGMTYVVINLLASTLLVTAVGFIYAATGTVNLADLAGKLAEIPPGVRSALAFFLLVVFGIKSAIFPLFFWLPDSYPTAPTPVTAIFAGLLTKVGVYAIVRTQTLLFPGDGPSTVILVLAGLTMVVGVLGAIAQDDVKRILSFHIISQIGYMIMGLGFFTVAGVAGAVYFMIHQIPVKTALFLVGGLVEQATGTGALRKLGGVVRRAPVVALLFVVPALSIAGLPPFSGFVAKLALVQAGLDIDQALIVGVSLGVSILTLYSMVKIWTGVFWGRPDVEPPRVEARGEGPLSFPGLMVGGTTIVVALVLIIGFAAAPFWSLSLDAATTLVERTDYIEAVLGP